MECVVWKSKMELILSEYLISIRVVDYCSLGLLSKNKIKRERVPIGKYIFIGVRECKKSQLTNAEHWQELKQMLTVARGWNWMSLAQISSTASQQKRPSHLMQQHAETLFRTGCAGLWSSGDLQRLFCTRAGQMLHVLSCLSLDRPGSHKSLSFNNLFYLIMVACTSTKCSNRNTEELIRIKDELTTPRHYCGLECMDCPQLLPWQSCVRASKRDLRVV